MKLSGEPARLQRVPRVRIAQIATDYLAHGWSADEMCRQHPYLEHAEVHSAMAYYFDHLEEINAEIQAEWDEATSQIKRSDAYTRLKARGVL